MVDRGEDLVDLLRGEGRIEDMDLAREMAFRVDRLEEGARRRARKVVRAQRIDRRARKRLLGEDDLHAHPLRDPLEDLEIADERLFVDDVPRHQGTLTGLKFSCQGSPWALSSAMNGSGSNSSQVWTPFSVHMPSRNIFAPIIAGTPVV